MAKSLLGCLLCGQLPAIRAREALGKPYDFLKGADPGEARTTSKTKARHEPPQYHLMTYKLAPTSG